MASALQVPVCAPSAHEDLRMLLGRTLPARPLNISVVGAHPDDPETGCGGSISKFAGDGHRLSIIYLTRGEAGVNGGNHSEIARIRSGEAMAAAGILGADAIFANQIDGKTSAGEPDVSRFTEILMRLAPDLVFSHWPIDTHPDHRNTAALTRAAWERMERSFTIVYYEVMTGIQTHFFEPNAYVDVTSTEDAKRVAIHAHVCQNPGRFYPHHVAMEKQRGVESGSSRAEAFIIERISQRSFRGEERSECMVKCASLDSLFS